MAEALNARLHDAFTRRSLRVVRRTRTLERAVWAHLAVLEGELLAALKGADPFEHELLRRRQRTIQAVLEAEVTPLVTARYARLAAEMQEAMLALALDEIAATQQLVQTVTEADLLAETPSAGRVRRQVQETLIPTATTPTDLSATGATWWERQGTGVVQRMGDQLMVAAALNETLTQATARLRGTPDQGFRDGVLARARTDAARLAQTQVSSAVTQARMTLATANMAAQLVHIHSSILDSKTSYICIGRHGLMWTIGTRTPIGHSIPYGAPPLHPNCRSTIILGLRAGGALAQETFPAWLRRQGTAFQDDLLGPTRARMFREGRLTPKNLLEASTGRPLRLDELDA